MPRSQSAAQSRLGLRDVATAAGVSVMSVSLALRDNPRIPAATRSRIRKIAADLGYRPDPMLARLMTHLRVSRTAHGNTGVAIVDFFPTTDHPENGYNRQVRQGATARAAQLGFSVTRIHGADYQNQLGKILHVIRARGIEGVLLMPSVVPLQLDRDAGWDGLSVVATSKSILAPRFHCVVPDHFGNMMRLFGRLRERGCARIGAVFDEFFNERTGQAFAAAVKWHGQERFMLILPQNLTASARTAQVVAWVAEHRPDALFAQGDAVVQAWPRIRAIRPHHDVQLIGLGAENFGAHPHLDECASLIGAAAIDLLGGMMYYHETGVPEHPRMTSIDGRLVTPGSGRRRLSVHARSTAVSEALA